MDYLAWITRAVTFVEALRKMPGRVRRANSFQPSQLLAAA